MARRVGFDLLLVAVAGLLISAVPPASAQGNPLKQIAPDEALLDGDEAGRVLQRIEAGYINNKLYVEGWLFDNAQMYYRKLSGRLFFTRASFSEDRTLERYCGENSERCSDVQLKQYSKRFISVVYRNPDGSVCAGLDYVSEDGRGAGRAARIFGNYMVSLEHCRHSGSDPEQVLAQGVEYLAAAKKDGRSIAKLSGYDLPKLTEPSQ
ncbi:MAG: hypothetical protein HKN28_05690 [Alphaproteobacteria bacterium]|nr:hypothetical protein [Alphaproteobacteria bacterium]